MQNRGVITLGIISLAAGILFIVNLFPLSGQTGWLPGSLKVAHAVGHPAVEIGQGQAACNGQGLVCLYEETNFNATGPARIYKDWFEDCQGGFTEQLEDKGFKDVTSSWVNNSDEYVEAWSASQTSSQPLFTMPPHTSYGYVGTSTTGEINSKVVSISCAFG